MLRKMSFKIDVETELDYPLAELFGNNNNSKYYPFVELTLNVNVFIVKLDVEHQDEEVLRTTLFFTEFQHVLDCVQTSWVKDFSVSLLTPEYQNDGQYKISDLVKVYQAKDEAEQEAFLFVCIDGNRYIDSALAESEEELILGDVIYFRSEKTS